MGVIELGNPTGFNEKQLFLIKEHLALVEKREYTFCNWLDGFLSANEDDSLNCKNFDKIVKKLNQEFRDVIDPSYSSDILQELNTAHNFNQKNSQENKPRDLLC